MIIELLCTPLFVLIKLIVNLLPTTDFALPNYISQTLDMLAVPLNLFPLDLWVLIISNVSFWYVAQMSWAGIEWVYKKLPGVD